MLTSDHVVTSKSSVRPIPAPMERAQRVWLKARELAGSDDRAELSAMALELLRVAEQDPATMAHGLRVGRTQLTGADVDTVGARAVGLLERAIAFLGAKPATGRANARRRPR